MSGKAALRRPGRDEILAMPFFEGLPPERIRLVKTAAEAEAALRALSAARFVGFDTESKPIFRKETVQTGPHVIQFATLEEAFIVQTGPGAPMDFVRTVIESQDMLKAGFGLTTDKGLLWNRFQMQLGRHVDLSQAVRNLGYRDEVGLKTAVAIVLGKRLRKSRSVTTSNWGQAILTPKQLSYAADDAYAALAVFHAMGLGLQRVS